MIQHDFPFIDTNDLNLDWLLKNMKQIIQQWADYQVEMNQNFTDLEAAFTALREFIMYYFDNLDVQEEINNKLDSMVASGELIDILQPTISTETSAWLAEHISQPSTPAVDTSLTVSGAAADSKTVGDNFKVSFMRRTIPDEAHSTVDEVDYIDLNYSGLRTYSGWYTMSSTQKVLNSPEDPATEGQRYFILYKSGSALTHMVYCNAATKVFAYRVFYNSQWYGWRNLVDSSTITALNSAINSINTELDSIYQRFAIPEEAFTTVDDTTYLDFDYSGLRSYSGWYIIPHDTYALHSPETDTTQGQRIFFIYKSSGALTHMIYLNQETNCFAFRLYANNAWSGWDTLALNSVVSSLQTQVDATFQRRSLPDESQEIIDGVTYVDLNSSSLLTYSGWYILGAAYKTLNSPDSNTSYDRDQRLFWVYKSGSALTHMVYWGIPSGNYAFRVYYSGSWKAWKKINIPALASLDISAINSLDIATINDMVAEYENADTRSLSFTPAAQISQGDNTGYTLNVMSYNVARYNNNSAVYPSDEQVFNIRKMIQNANVDIIGTQENFLYIDGTNTGDDQGTESAHDYLYKPQYPYAVNFSNCHNVLYTKKQLSNTGIVRYSTENHNYGYRIINYGVLEIDSDTSVLVCSTHPDWNDTGSGGNSATSIARRLQQYTELMKWCNGDITLKGGDTSTDVTVPTHTHVIIMMDGNTSTDDDKINLQTVAAANNFILGNGGALGWIYTQRQYVSPYAWLSLDNIIVSDNVIINKINALTSQYTALYSDHVPLVANVTLLPDVNP